MSLVLTALGVALQRVLFIFLFNSLTLCIPAGVLQHRMSHQKVMPCTLCCSFPQALTWLVSSCCLCSRWSLWSLRNCSMAADLGFILAGCLIISAAEKGVLFTHRTIGLKPFHRLSVGGPAWHRLLQSCSCAGLLIQWGYKENMPFIVKME